MPDLFLDKSFLFEIVYSETNIVMESFTLVIPPQSYSIKEKQRVNITKTFGNAFIDDYGSDNLEITIKGISGTSSVFPTFQTASGNDTGMLTGMRVKVQPTSYGFNHQSAFYYFRDRIMRYKDNYPDKFDQLELRVYDLADLQAYKCVLLEFSVDRSADRPMYYPFTISLFVYAKFGDARMAAASVIQTNTNPLLALANILAALDNFQKTFIVFTAVQSIKNAVASFSNQMTLIANKISSIVATTLSVIESPLVLIKQGIDLVVTLAGVIDKAYVAGSITYDKWVNAKESIQYQIDEALALYSIVITSDSFTYRDIKFEIGTGLASNPENPEAAMSPSSRTQSYPTTGMARYTVRGGDTLQRIALNRLGDDSLWMNIAAVNPSIGSNSDIYPGMEILVPTTSEVVSLKDSLILSEDTARDPYGSDIQLDEHGNMVVYEGGAVATVSGIDNVVQAINTRVATQIGSMIKQTAFGMLSSVGYAGSTYAIAYAKMNFQNALIQDPRVASVDKVNVEFMGDGLQLGADITLVGRDTTLPVFVVI